MPGSTFQDQSSPDMALLPQGQGRPANYEEEAEGNTHKATLSSPAKPELRIRHYMSRGNGVLVPVIPLDELPLELHGVPSHLLWEDTRSMTFLGELASTGTTYAISEIKQNGFGASGNAIVRHGRGFASLDQDVKMPETIDAFQRLWRGACAAAEWDAVPVSCIETVFVCLDERLIFVYQNPDHDEDFNELARELRDEEDNVSVMSFPFSISATLQAYDPSYDPPDIPIRDRTSKSVPATTSEKPPINAFPSSRPLPPSGVEPDETRKEFCSYWIRTGECAFTQQGCKYKHEMPPDRITLKRVFGIDQWPKWWIERFPNDSRVLAMYPNPHRLVLSSGSRGRVPPGRDFMAARSWRTDGRGRPAMTPIAAFSSLAAAARANPKQKGTVSPPKGQGGKNAGKNISSGGGAGSVVDPVATKMAAILHDPFRSARTSRAPSVADTDLIDLESIQGSRPPMSRTQSTVSTTTNTTIADARRPLTVPQKKIDFPRLFVNEPNEPKKKSPKQSKQSSKKSSKQSSPTSEVSSSETPRKRVDNDNDDDGDDESGGATASASASASTGSEDVKGSAGKILAVKEVVGGAAEQVKKKSKKNHGATRQRRRARELAMTKEIETGAETETAGESGRGVKGRTSSSSDQQTLAKKGKERTSSSDQQTLVKKGKEVKRESPAGEKQEEYKALKEKSSSSNEDMKKGEQKKSDEEGKKKMDDEGKKDVQKENIPPKTE